jgi:hypothetical protein
VKKGTKYQKSNSPVSFVFIPRKPSNPKRKHQRRCTSSRLSGNPGNPNVNVLHLILSSRPSESIKLSFVLRYGIVSIENAIPTEKHPHATFLTPNAQQSVIASFVNDNNKIHPKRASRFRRAIFWLCEPCCLSHRLMSDVLAFRASSGCESDFLAQRMIV